MSICTISVCPEMIVTYCISSWIKPLIIFISIPGFRRNHSKWFSSALNFRYQRNNSTLALRQGSRTAVAATN